MNSTRLTHTLSTLLLLLALPWCQPAGASSQGDQVQLKGELFEVRAVVTDDRGRVRDDLRREDFELLVNGKPRDIAFFSLAKADAPAPPASPAARSTDAAAAATGGAPGPAPAGRSVLLFVDAANMSPNDLSRARKALLKFVDARVTNDDLVAVASSGTPSSVGLFTKDKAAVRAAIEKINPRPTSFTSGAFTPYLAAQIVAQSSPDALAAGMYLVRAEEGIPPPLDADVPGGSASSNRLMLLARQRAIQVLEEASRQRQIGLDALRAAVASLSKAPGQRLLALVSDGFTLFDREGGRDTAQLQQIIATAVRSGVVIYSLAGEGLESGVFSGVDDPYYTLPAYQFPGLGTASKRDLEDGLNALAKDTGGEVYRNTNDLEGSLGRMLDANRAYYVISFYPGDDGDEPRTIELRLRNRPGLNVRAQRGVGADVAAPEVEGSRPVLDALTSPAAQQALPLTLRAEFVGPSAGGALANVTVHVDGEHVTFADEGGRKSFNLELATAVSDATGALAQTKVETLDGRLSARAADLARSNGFRVTRQLSLAPGRYVVRAALREPGTGKIGTATATLEVPDLASGRPALSALALAATNSEGGDVFLPRVVAGVRTFRKADLLVYTTTAFNANADADVMRIAISQGQTVLFRSAWEPLGSRITERKPDGIRLSGQLGLSSVPPGPYVLRVEIRDANATRTAAATAEFAVVE